MSSFCKNCASDIDKFGCVAQVIYEHVCEYYDKNQKALIMDEKEINHIPCRNPVVNFLEKKGFLSTTELCNHRIAIKPTVCKHKKMLVIINKKEQRVNLPLKN